MVSSHISLIKNHNNTNTLITLPGEIWRLVFSFLRAGDLCRCAMVSKEWNTLVLSIDSTRWKELFLQQRKHKRWKHPYWPNNLEKQPKSWKGLYRQRYRASRLWLRESYTPSCTSKLFFKQTRARRKFCVGYGKTYRSIKSALDKASAYDSIYVYPGIYQDPTPLVIKCPCAIIGVDDPTKVVLTMQLEIKAESVKLENLSIKPMYPRARRRSSMFILLKIFHGHAFIFNCIFEEGHIHAVSPGVLDLHSCTFNTAFINFQGVSYSSIRNCEFKPDRYAVFVEEPLFQSHTLPSVVPADVGGWVEFSDQKKFQARYKKEIKERSRKHNSSANTLSLYSKSISSGFTDSDFSDSDHETKNKNKSNFSRKSRLSSLKSAVSTKVNPIDEEEKLFDDPALELLSTTRGVIINNIRVLGGRGGIMICRMGQAWIQNSVFTECVCAVRCLQNSKCIFMQNEIHDCETTGIFMKDNSKGFIAGNQIHSNGEAGIDIRSGASPIIQHNELYNGKRSGIVCLDNGNGMICENDFHDNQEAAIYILHKGCPRVIFDRRTYAMDVFLIKQQVAALLKLHSIADVNLIILGVVCRTANLKNTSGGGLLPRNNIWSGRAAGIAITEDGRGHISNNTIIGLEWAGIDVRNGGNPVISHNLIQNGHSDGIVVGEGGKSVILDNIIDDNNGCGLWILDGSHPLIHSNHITNNRNSGIAFVKTTDHEHGNQHQDVQIPKSRGVNNNNEERDDEPSNLFLEEDDFIFPLPALEQEPESRFVHVSKPDKKLAQLEGNTIEHNHGNGIQYEGEEGIVISKNKINFNQLNGINLAHTSDTTVENNTISNNKLSGVNVELGVNSNITGNGIYGNNEYGIVTAGVGMIKDNDIFGHHLPSLFMLSIADLTVTNNRMYTSRHTCIEIEEKARCVIAHNEIYTKNETKVINRHEISDVTFEDNNKIIQLDEAGDEDDEYDADDVSNKEIDDDLLLTKIKLWRPYQNEDDQAASAPFYTASQMKTKTVRSSFCILL